LALSSWVPEIGVRQFLLKNLKRSENGGFEWKINLPVIADQIESVGQPLPSGLIDIPTLFMSGEKSSYILPPDIEAIVQQFPQAKFEIIGNAGHWVHAENPQDFVSVLLNYLAS
jgi:pimeloyl-ACP methyl ester carboxylesterase